LSNTAALGASLRGAADMAGLRIVADNRSVPLSPDPRLLQRAFTSMAALGEVDVVVAGILDAQRGDLVEILRQMAQIARHSEVVLLVCLVSSVERVAAVQSQVRADSALPPVHATPYSVVRTSAGMLRAAQRPRVDEEEPAQREDIDRAAARRLVEEALDRSGEDGTTLPPEEGAALLRHYGVDVLTARTVHHEEDALAAAEEIGYPLALKSSDPVLRHRADLGGVRLGLADAAQPRRARDATSPHPRLASAPTLVRAAPPRGSRRGAPRRHRRGPAPPRPQRDAHRSRLLRRPARAAGDGPGRGADGGAQRRGPVPGSRRLPLRRGRCDRPPGRHRL